MESDVNDALHYPSSGKYPVVFFIYSLINIFINFWFQKNKINSNIYKCRFGNEILLLLLLLLRGGWLMRAVAFSTGGAIGGGEREAAKRWRCFTRHRCRQADGWPQN